jgi:hypothetical protein
MEDTHRNVVVVEANIRDETVGLAATRAAVPDNQTAGTGNDLLFDSSERVISV